MKSDIKNFRVDARYVKGHDFAFNEAKRQMLSEFDEWIESEKPTILAVNFGKKDSVYMYQMTMGDLPHYWWMEVLYLEDIMQQLERLKWIKQSLEALPEKEE